MIPTYDPTRRAAQKLFRDGTHRVVDPASTLEKIRKLAPSMGITRVANVTGLDIIGIPVVTVVRPNSRSLAVAQGKGIDLDAAKVSGLMESIENWHAENVVRPLILDSELAIVARGGTVVDVTGLPRCAGGSYRPDAKILWIEGHDVLGRRRCWLPFETVHADYTPPLPTGSQAFLMTDSGIASGNHPLEAVSHGLCELVERDAVTLWQYGGGSEQTASRVDLETVDDPNCRWALEKLAAASVLAAVWDTTTDIGIPSFLCQIMDAEPNPWRPLGPTSGAGCHPSRAVALFRALSEAAQARLTKVAGSRDDLSLHVYARGEDSEGIARESAIMRQPATRCFELTPTLESESLDEDVAWELERLSAVGIEQAIVVDLSMREIGLSVVRVVIPGLEGIGDAPAFVPGRRLRARLA
jgi:YcaO-like protein with predicted kinase domain